MSATVKEIYIKQQNNSPLGTSTDFTISSGFKVASGKYTRNINKQIDTVMAQWHKRMTVMRRLWVRFLLGEKKYYLLILSFLRCLDPPLNAQCLENSAEKIDTTQNLKNKSINNIIYLLTLY